MAKFSLLTLCVFKYCLPHHCNSKTSTSSIIETTIHNFGQNFQFIHSNILEHTFIKIHTSENIFLIYFSKNASIQDIIEKDYY